MRYARTDAAGVPIAFYDDAANDVPSDAFAITDAQWRECLDHPGERRFDGGGLVVIAPAAPITVLLPDISDRQFARGLWGDGIIDYADFLGFIGPGTIPAPLQAIVDTLPDDDTGAPTPRKDAVGFLTGAKSYAFAHPLVAVFRQAMAARDPRWTPDFLHDRWLAWSAA